MAKAQVTCVSFKDAASCETSLSQESHTSLRRTTRGGQNVVLKKNVLGLWLWPASRAWWGASEHLRHGYLISVTSVSADSHGKELVILFKVCLKSHAIYALLWKQEANHISWK